MQSSPPERISLQPSDPMSALSIRLRAETNLPQNSAGERPDRLEAAVMRVEAPRRKATSNRPADSQTNSGNLFT